MARIVSYKVRDDSTYSTFENSSAVNRSAITNSGKSDLDKAAWYKCATCSTWCCCHSGSQESVSDDIDAHFSLARQAQVWLTSLHLTASLLYLKPARSIWIQRKFLEVGSLFYLFFGKPHGQNSNHKEIYSLKNAFIINLHLILLSDFNNMKHNCA